MCQTFLVLLFARSLFFVTRMKIFSREEKYDIYTRTNFQKEGNRTTLFIILNVNLKPYGSFDKPTNKDPLIRAK